MSEPGAVPQPQGFRVSELVLVIVILLALGLIAVPHLYDARREANEAQAQEMLRMIGSAQESWRQATGRWAELFELQFAPGESNELLPFLPFFPVSANTANYGGYRFIEQSDGQARPTGCRAEPITPPFSGRRIFEFSYETGELVELAPVGSKSATALE